VTFNLMENPDFGSSNIMKELKLNTNHVYLLGLKYMFTSIT